MQRPKIWYRRYLFKQHFRSYRDWDKFNPASDHKAPYRYRSDALVCRNPDCPREHMPISEHEAYYYFAQHRFWGRIRLKFLCLFRTRDSRRVRGLCYVCPFCGHGDVEECRERREFRKEYGGPKRNKTRAWRKGHSPVERLR